MPLTTRGIAIQVLASIRAHRDHAEDCTVNDCKVVVNHLIRKFSEPLGRAGEAQAKMSESVRAGASGNTVRDHAVPVIVLLEELLTLEPERLAISDENIDYVEDFLRRSLYVVEITDAEDLHASLPRARASEVGVARGAAASRPPAGPPTPASRPA